MGGQAQDQTALHGEHPANALAVECALAELPGVVKAFADAVKGRAGLMQSHRQQMFSSGPGNSDQRLNFLSAGSGTDAAGERSASGTLFFT